MTRYRSARILRDWMFKYWGDYVPAPIMEKFFTGKLSVPMGKPSKKNIAERDLIVKAIGKYKSLDKEEYTNLCRVQIPPISIK